MRLRIAPEQEARRLREALAAAGCAARLRSPRTLEVLAAADEPEVGEEESDAQERAYMALRFFLTVYAEQHAFDAVVLEERPLVIDEEQFRHFSDAA